MVIENHNKVNRNLIKNFMIRFSHEKYFYINKRRYGPKIKIYGYYGWINY